MNPFLGKAKLAVIRGIFADLPPEVQAELREEIAAAEREVQVALDHLHAQKVLDARLPHHTVDPRDMGDVGQDLKRVRQLLRELETDREGDDDETA